MVSLAWIIWHQFSVPWNLKTDLRAWNVLNLNVLFLGSKWLRRVFQTKKIYRWPQTSECTLPLFPEESTVFPDRWGNGGSRVRITWPLLMCVCVLLFMGHRNATRTRAHLLKEPRRRKMGPPTLFLGTRGSPCSIESNNFLIIFAKWGWKVAYWELPIVLGAKLARNWKSLSWR